MRFFFILIALIFGGIYFFLEFVSDSIVKKIIENKLSEVSQREVKIDNLNIDLFKEAVNLKSIIIKNSEEFPGELLKINNVKIIISFKSILSDTVEVKVVDINGADFQYKVLIRNGQIVDNLSLINQALNKERSSKSDSGKKIKTYPVKEQDKNFIIKKLIFKNIYAQVISDDLEINTKTKLSNMEFLNVGNSKNANHFKDVTAMILNNVLAKVQNDVLKQKVKQKFEKKINELLKRNTQDLFKKFDKFLK